jgi:hypothetical protein
MGDDLRKSSGHLIQRPERGGNPGDALVDAFVAAIRWDNLATVFNRHSKE